MRRRKFHNYELISYSDVNELAEWVQTEGLTEVLKNVLIGEKDVILSGLVVSASGTPDDLISIAIGYGVARSGAVLINPSALSESFLSITTNRYCNVEVRQVNVDGDPQTRYFIDVNGNTSVATIDKATTQEIEARIVEGSISEAPAVASGWTKIAEVFWDGSAVTSADIKNVDAEFSVEENTGWTTEPSITILHKSIHNHRNASVIDHPDQSITFEKLANSAVQSIRTSQIGAIIEFHANMYDNLLPANVHLCDGQALDRSTYADLAEVIGLAFSSFDDTANIFTPAPVGMSLHSIITYANNLYFCLGGGKAYKSSDAISWSQMTDLPTGAFEEGYPYFTAIVWNSNASLYAITFVNINLDGGGGSGLFTSPDATTWTARSWTSSIENEGYLTVFVIGATFYAMGRANYAWSSNGTSWNTSEYPDTRGLKRACVVGTEIWVTFTIDPTDGAMIQGLWKVNVGTAFTQISSTMTPRNMCRNVDNIVMIGDAYLNDNDITYYSTDGGSNWLTSILPFDASVYQPQYSNLMLYADGAFFVTIGGTSMYRTVTGETWNEVASLLSGKSMTGGLLKDPSTNHLRSGTSTTGMIKVSLEDIELIQIPSAHADPYIKRYIVYTSV